MSEHYIEEENLSLAWVKIAEIFLRVSGKEIVPLIVSITSFDAHGEPHQLPGVRDGLDKHLRATKRQGIETVANTVFPRSYWNPSLPRTMLYERFLANLSRLRHAHKQNARGMYFERMITGGPESAPNQLEFALSQFSARKGVRRSALQLGIFHPTKDHSRAALLGFPCLQHVTFAPAEGGLHVNAMYASQYAVSRAYGNYLGLSRLGAFIAHELDIPLARVTCFTGVMLFDDNKAPIRDFLKAVPHQKAQGGTYET